jgi:hypothetical protein
MKPGFPNYDWQRKRGQVRLGPAGGGRMGVLAHAEVG